MRSSLGFIHLHSSPFLQDLPMGKISKHRALVSVFLVCTCAFIELIWFRINQVVMESNGCRDISNVTRPPCYFFCQLRGAGKLFDDGSSIVLLHFIGFINCYDRGAIQVDRVRISFSRWQMLVPSRHSIAFDRIDLCKIANDRCWQCGRDRYGKVTQQRSRCNQNQPVFIRIRLWGLQIVIDCSWLNWQMFWLLVVPIGPILAMMVSLLNYTLKVMPLYSNI